MADQGAPTRTLVLWIPEWPVAALGRDPAAPVAVVAGNTVVACSAAARAEGVRRGQRRRDAQARCPTLDVVAADESRDQRVFAPLVARVEELAPGVQIVRPGLCALRVRGSARYYGGEAEAARVLLRVLREAGFGDARGGVADGPFTAEQAAVTGSSRVDPVFIVPAGGSAGFLAPLSVAVLDDSPLAGRPAPSAPADLVGLLARLGVQTLGEFAAMPDERVRERFGERGIRLHSLAAGRDSQPVQPRTPPPEMEREVAFEPPLEIVDQVAFGMRIAADEFVARLGVLGLVCTELRVALVGERGEQSERVWLHPASFDAAAIVDRVRWQLGEDSEGLRSGVALVRIAPEGVEAAHDHRPALFGGGPEERVHHALSRVQAMLGHRGVLTPQVGGGRWLSERQVLVPWGDRAVVAAARAQPWPGALPDPLPATVFAEPPTVEVLSLGGFAVEVDGRGALPVAPGVLVEGGRRREIVAWAGPWPVIERGWDLARSRRAHRFQVVDADGEAWLLVCERGVWTAEGRYD
jgi:protein ImuB